MRYDNFYSNFNQTKMATDSEPRKKRARQGFRYQMELYFTSEDHKEAFLSRMKDAKRLLAPRGYPPLDNRELICSLLDKVEAAVSLDESLADSGAQSQTQTVPALPMLDNSGLHVAGTVKIDPIMICYSVLGFFTGNSSTEDQSLFVCEKNTFYSLCSSLTQPCKCQGNSHKLINTIQVILNFIHGPTDFHSGLCTPTERACPSGRIPVC